MIRVDVFSSSPVYRLGLVHLLQQEEGISVLAEGRWPEREHTSFLADATVIDAETLDDLRRPPSAVPGWPGTPVLVVNARPAATAALLTDGASSVLEKGESCESVVEAVRAVTEGGGGAASLLDALADEPPTPRNAADQALSARESEVLTYIAHGLTHGQIASRLHISPHTVDTYVKRIRSKLGIGNKAELTRFALLRDATRERVRSRTDPFCRNRERR